MKKNTISYIKKLKGISLSSTEAHEMRARLSAYADLHEVVPAEKAARGTAPSGSFFTAFSFSQFVNLRAGIAVAIILVLVGSSAGVTYAAEDSLPGQPLYAIKVSVAEPIQGALITTTVGKAQWQNDLAERRLAEASTLATQNNLATSTQVYIQNAVATHVALAEEDADTLAASGNESAALSVRSDLEAKLSAHADILTLIAPKLAAAGDATTTDAVLALLQNVEADRTEVEFSRETTEAALAAGAAATSTSAWAGGNIAMNADATTSSADARADIALADADTTGQQTEEVPMLKADAGLLRLAPSAMAPATSTASTTATTTLFARWHLHIGTTVLATSTISLPTGLTSETDPQTELNPTGNQ